VNEGDRFNEALEGELKFERQVAAMLDAQLYWLLMRHMKELAILLVNKMARCKDPDELRRLRALVDVSLEYTEHHRHPPTELLKEFDE
jgi:hypothetical protein